MEQLCYRCHAEIPENTAFCPHCGAPQIRVVLPETEASEQASPPSEAMLQVEPVPPPPPAWTQRGVPFPRQPGAIQWHLAWKSALLLGVGAAALFIITAPVMQILAFVWIAAAGFFATRVYRRTIAYGAISPGMGMRLGALTGLFGALPIAVMSLASFAAIRSNGELRQTVEDQMRRQMPANADPKMQEMMQNMLAWVSTPQGAATMALFLVLVFVVLSAAGGALGASFTRQRHQPH